MSSQNVKPLTGKKKKKRNTFCNLKCLYCTIKYISIYHIYHFCLVLTIHVEAINRYTVAFQLSSVRLNACSGEVWFISPRLFSVCSGIDERAGVLISKIYSLTLTTPPQLTWTPPPSSLPASTDTLEKMSRSASCFICLRSCKAAPVSLAASVH